MRRTEVLTRLVLYKDLLKSVYSPVHVFLRKTLVQILSFVSEICRGYNANIPLLSNVNITFG